MLNKKLVSGVIALALVFTLVGAVSPALADTTMMTTTSTTTSMTGSAYMFNMNLTMGSTGPDVVALQNVLVAKGFLTIPSGTAMGYFGTLTKMALMRMQAAVGISPASGYFGPISRAYFAAHPELTGGSMTTMSTTPGCPTGAMYNTMNGTPCSTTTMMTPGCVAGAMYNSMTGAMCSMTSTTTTTTTTNSTTEGTLTVTQGTPGSNGNIQQNVNVPVYGIQLQAKLGNVRVDRLDLDVMDRIGSGSGSIENPGNFINNIQVWDGSTVLVNRNVNQSDFVTGTSSSDYYVRLSGINFNVPANTTKNLTVVFSTSGSIDTQRILTIRGYGSASLLGYSGVNNTASYYDVSNISTTQTFAKPGIATVTLGADTNNPQSIVNYVDPNTGAQQTVLLAFDTNTTQGSSTVNEVRVNLNASGTNPNGLALYNGSNQISYVGIAAGTNASTTVVFSNIPTGSVMSGNNVYYIKADFPSNTATGTLASTTVTQVSYLSSNGTIQQVNGPVRGNTQIFNPATAQLAFQRASASANGLTQGASSTVTATFNFTLTPRPGDEVYPQASDFTVVARSSNGTNYTIGSKGITVSGNNVNQSSGILSANSTYSVTLTATGNSSSLPASDTYTFYLTSASTTVKDYQGNQVQYTQTAGLDNYHTDPVYYTRQ